MNFLKRFITFFIRPMKGSELEEKKDHDILIRLNGKEVPIVPNEDLELVENSDGTFEIKIKEGR